MFRTPPGNIFSTATAVQGRVQCATPFLFLLGFARHGLEVLHSHREQKAPRNYEYPANRLPPPPPLPRHFRSAPWWDSLRLLVAARSPEISETFFKAVV